MLNVCSKGHEEIVYHGNHCPMCHATAEKERAERDRDAAQGEADKLRATVEQMLGN
jgi:hypothetical protein